MTRGQITIKGPEIDGVRERQRLSYICQRMEITQGQWLVWTLSAMEKGRFIIDRRLDDEQFRQKINKAATVKDTDFQKFIIDSAEQAADAILHGKGNVSSLRSDGAPQEREQATRAAGSRDNGGSRGADGHEVQARGRTRHSRNQKASVAGRAKLEATKTARKSTAKATVGQQKFKFSAGVAAALSAILTGVLGISVVTAALSTNIALKILASFVAWPITKFLIDSEWWERCATLIVPSIVAASGFAGPIHAQALAAVILLCLVIAAAINVLQGFRLIT